MKEAIMEQDSEEEKQDSEGSASEAIRFKTEVGAVTLSKECLAQASRTLISDPYWINWT